ncbi:MAG: trimeric intracellular cation channel family protein [Candidatus Cloacimonetes bacterium]|nr:trimeric intracellular cation channel family protein [Candidatus Cloacimonadota bacterium]
MLYYLDLLGTLVFAISGALRASKHNLDILGVLVLSVVTGVSGGIIRDMIIGDNLPAAFRNEWYLMICVIGGILVFIATPKIAKSWNVVRYFDAVGLGVFAAIGATKALQYGAGPIGVIMLSAITATGGGMLRDVLVREIPAVLHRDFYATAAMLGAVVLLILNYFECSQFVQIFSTIAVTTGIRFTAMYFQVQLPIAKRAETELD